MYDYEDYLRMQQPTFKQQEAKTDMRTLCMRVCIHGVKREYDLQKPKHINEKRILIIYISIQMWNGLQLLCIVMRAILLLLPTNSCTDGW